jgi:hypothetical protein
LVGYQNLGSVAGITKAIEATVEVAVVAENWQLAARLLAVAARLHLETKVLLAGFKQDAIEALSARVKQQLGEAAFEQHWNAGSAMSAEAAAAEALSLLAPKPA